MSNRDDDAYYAQMAPIVSRDQWRKLRLRRAAPPPPPQPGRKTQLIVLARRRMRRRAAR